MTDVQGLEDYVKTITTSINNGVPDGFHLKGYIEVELVVVSSKAVGGKLSILIAEAGGKYQKEELSKIKFKIEKDVKGVSFTVPKSMF